MDHFCWTVLRYFCWRKFKVNVEDTESSQATAGVIILKSINKWIKCFSLQIEINTVSLSFDPGTEERQHGINSWTRSQSRKQRACTGFNLDSRNVWVKEGPSNHPSVSCPWACLSWSYDSGDTDSPALLLMNGSAPKTSQHKPASVCSRTN